MTRFTFGGGAADFVYTGRMVGGQDYVTLSPATVTFWDSQTGGTALTDLILNGAAASSIGVTASGQIPAFQGPDGITSMWADAGAARVQMFAYDAIADLSDTAMSAVLGNPASASSMLLSAAYGSVTVHGSTAGTARPTTSLPVLWVGTVAPTNAVNNDRWYNTSTGDEQAKVSGSFVYVNNVHNDLTYASRGSVGVDLAKVSGFVAGADNTARLQALIDDTSVKTIAITASTTISTITIPVNRNVRIFTPWFVNIAGDLPLITIASGGNGFKLNGSSPSLAVGVQLENLSFTSNGVAVNGAITGQDVTGCYFKSLYFSNIKGSAIAITGHWFDSGCDDLVMMDCGDTGVPVVLIGSTGADPNRVVWKNCRIERSASTQLKLAGNCYEIDFIGCKFHGPVTDQATMIDISSGSQKCHFIGGQMHATYNALGGTVITCAGNYNTFTNIMVTSDSGANTLLNATGWGNRLSECTIENYVTPVTISGTSNEVASCNFLQCGRILMGTLGSIHDCEFRNINLAVGQTAVVFLAIYGKAINNTFNGWNAAATYAIDSGGTGSIIEGNHIVGDGSHPSNGIWVHNASVIAKNNIGSAIPGVTIYQNDVDSTRDISGNTDGPTVVPIPLLQALSSGTYFSPFMDTATSATQGNGSLRVGPWFNPQPITLSAIGVDVTAAGDSGCKIRVGIYADNKGYPGALILDAGQLAADAIGTPIPALGSNLVLPRGWYWIGGAVQLVTTTQPTVRIASGRATPTLQISQGTSFAANATANGYRMTGVTGALPSTFTSTVDPIAGFPRLHFKVA